MSNKHIKEKLESQALTESILNGVLFSLLCDCPFSQFYHLALLHILAIYHKSYEGAHLVPAMHTRSAGVHMQAFQLVVVNDFEDVGVAGDEELGGVEARPLLVWYNAPGSHLCAS